MKLACHMELLSPSFVLCNQSTSLMILTAKFNFVDAELAQSQYSAMKRYNWMETSSPCKFWIEASAVEDACGRRKFGEIAKLAFAFLSLPFANADV